MNSDFWNERYASEELIYGEAPNDFLVRMSECLPSSGTALDIGAGEGRNALFLASRGLDVLAVDQSEVGLSKAQRLAQIRGLTLRTQVADLQELRLESASLDVVSSVFVHLPATLRADLYRRVCSWLKPEGVFVLEAFAPDQIGRGTGGPSDPSRYAPLETLLEELAELEIEHAADRVRHLAEGRFHTGEASVVQVLARKR